MPEAYLLLLLDANEPDVLPPLSYDHLLMILQSTPYWLISISCDQQD